MVSPGYEGPYLLGIDYGTESCRAAIFDLAGRPIAFAATPPRITWRAAAPTSCAAPTGRPSGWAYPRWRPGSRPPRASGDVDLRRTSPRSSPTRGPCV